MTRTGKTRLPRVSNNDKTALPPKKTKKLPSDNMSTALVLAKPPNEKADVAIVPSVSKKGKTQGGTIEADHLGTTALVVTPKKRKRKATAAREKVKEGNRHRKEQVKVGSQGTIPKLPDYETAMDRFKRYAGDNPTHLWVIDEQEEGEDVLAAALDPRMSETAYLVVLNDDNHFSVVHSLVHLETELRSSNPVEGKIAGFVGNTRPGDTTPNVVVFDDEEALFSQHSYPIVSWTETMEHYAQPEYDYLPWSGDPGRSKGNRRRMMPIPPELVPVLLEGPVFEVAIQRVNEWVLSTTPRRAGECETLIHTMATAMGTTKKYSNISALTTVATKLVYNAPVRAFAQEWWHDINRASAPTIVHKLEDESSADEANEDNTDGEGEDEETSEVEGHNPKINHTVNHRHSQESAGDPPSSSGSDDSSTDSSGTDDDTASSGEDNSDDIDVEDPPPAKTKRRKITQVITPPTHKKKSKWGDLGEMAPFFEAMVRMSNKNLKTALKASSTAARATGQLASKLSVTRMEVLEACAGHDENDGSFIPPPIYDELNVAGWQKEAVYTALRRSCVGIKNSRHRSNVHVTNKMVLTFKGGNLAMGRDKTFDGCTAGVTPLAVPHLSQKMAHDDLLDNQAFEDATHKTQAENKKHLAGNRFTPPKTVQEVIRVLNNYICWLEVMFGGNCRHLAQVILLRDALDDNEEELELALDKHLRLSILWKVHEDARHFFDTCEKWRRGETLPRSRLAGTVALLENDLQVIKSITCPFDDFFKDDAKPKGNGKAKGGAGGGEGKEPKEPGKGKRRPLQPISNTAIPALCAAAVKKYQAAHPDMPITKFALESGIPTYRFVIGDKGNCTNFSLLGKCSASCNYKHEACTVPDGKQKEIATLLLEGMKTLADKKKTGTPP